MPDEDELSLPPGGIPIDDPVWQPWAPATLAKLLDSVAGPWYVAAGWALEEFRGEQTREHEDLETGVPNTVDAVTQVRAAYHADLAGVLPLLEPSDRSWLAAALQQIHPAREWLAQL